MSRLTTVRTPSGLGSIVLGFDAIIFFSYHPVVSVACLSKLPDSLLPFRAGRPIVAPLIAV